eukprot:gene22108-29167_t
MPYITLQLGVVRGMELPKADVLSEIDPYIKCYGPFSEAEAGGLAPRTGPCMSTVYFGDEPNPEWYESFFFKVEVNEDGFMVGVIRLELWDKENLSDEFCGISLLDLSHWPADLPRGGSYGTLLTLPVDYAGPKKKVYMKQNRNSRLVVRLVGSKKKVYMKQNRNSRQVVRLVGAIKASDELVHQLGPTAASFGTDDEQHLYKPIEHDIRMYAGSGRELMPGVLCYEEVVLRGLPLHVDYADLIISVQDRKAKNYVKVEGLLVFTKFPIPCAKFEAAAQAMKEEGALTDDNYVNVEELLVFTKFPSPCAKFEAAAQAMKEEGALTDDNYVNVKELLDSTKFAGPTAKFEAAVQAIKNYVNVEELLDSTKFPGPSANFEAAAQATEERGALMDDNYVNVEELLDSIKFPGPSANFEAAAQAMKEEGALTDDASIYVNMPDAGAKGSFSRALSKTKSINHTLSNVMVQLDYGVASEGVRELAGLPPGAASEGVRELAGLPPGAASEGMRELAGLPPGAASEGVRELAGLPPGVAKPSCLPPAKGQGPPQLHLLTTAQVASSKGSALTTSISKKFGFFKGLVKGKESGSKHDSANPGVDAKENLRKVIHSNSLKAGDGEEEGRSQLSPGLDLTSRVGGSSGGGAVPSAGSMSSARVAVIALKYKH